MPENDLQANLILTDRSGEMDRVASTPQTSYHQPEPWVDMLARIGDKNSRLYKRVVDREMESRRTILAELERERARIARELHAGAGQPLAGIIQNLEMLGEHSAEMPFATRAILSRLEKLAEQALHQVRSVSHRLYPPDWQRLTIQEALRRLVQTGVSDDLYTVTFQSDPLPFEPSHFTKVALYRCAQECISNMLRHARATHFMLSLRPAGGDIELEICDNGLGFADSGAGSGGIGIGSLHDSARMLGGTCHIFSGPEGTRVKIRIPAAVE